MTERDKNDEIYNFERKWMYQGEASAHDRPVNSLLELDIDYRQAQAVIKQSVMEEDEIKSLVKSRIRERVFDNFISEIPQENEKIEDLKIDNDSILTIEEIKDMIAHLNSQLIQISDMNNHITSYRSNNPRTKIPIKRKNRATDTTKKLKKYNNVEFI